MDTRQALDPVIRLVGSGLAFIAAQLVRLTGRRVGIALAYHAVGEPAGDAGRELVPNVATSAFRGQVRHLRSCYRLVAASELPDAIAERRRGQRIPVAITFDDDLASHAEVAAPVLQELGAPATFFITGATLDASHVFWWQSLQAAVDEARVEPSLLAGLVEDPAAATGGNIHDIAHAIKLLDPASKTTAERRLSEALGHPVETPRLPGAAVRELAEAGFEIGFHTRAHHYLPSVSAPELAQAMADGHSELAAAAGTVARVIAYPHGGAGPREAAAARAAGFETGYTTVPSVVRPDDDRLLLGRIEVVPCSAGRLALRVALRLLGLR